MTKNYIKLANTHYPSATVTCLGDPSVYSNINWQGTPIDQSQLDSHYLDDLKSEKISDIDVRTVELIKQGFAFDSQVFSLSEPAQLNWVGLKTLESILSWPVNITTKSDEQYALTQEDLPAFMGTGLATKQAHLDSGRALKVQVNASTTQAELDAVVDNR